MRFVRQNIDMKLGEAPEGVYKLTQHIDGDCNVRTSLTPIRKRWWWFGSWRRDKRAIELCGMIADLDDGSC